jgi:uncharacterized metal-binding protein YceD (DUF177 family)
MNDDNPSVLDWMILPEDVPAGSLKASKAASATERDAVAKALDLQELPLLEIAYTVKNIGDGVYRLKGQLTARVVQTCGVTLEPVPSEMSERIDIEFRPAEIMDDEKSGVIDLDDEIDVEPIVNDGMELGRVVFECFSAALDPYPRKSGASFAWQDPKAEEKPPSPFAVLAKLKKGD